MMQGLRMKLSKIGLYYHTARHLRPIQLINRVQRGFAQTTRPIATLSPRTQSGKPIDFVFKPTSILGRNKFQFLNEECTVSSVLDWNDPSNYKLWLYNLHYHDGLSCPETTDELKRNLIDRWIIENPLGHGNGWEPYPLSLRIVNWVKWLLSGNEPVEGMLESLASQVHSLTRQLEYHLLGNHLFANAKALVFAGCFFEGGMADKWLQKGLKILRREIPEQFLDDGAHFELSTTYHATLTEDLLDIINILKAYNQMVPEEWNQVGGKAVAWQQTMTQPDGLPPLFNDAVYGISPSLADIEAYAARLGLDIRKFVAEPLTDLPLSGYFRYQGDNYSFFGDAGQIGPDYIPGHAHSDMLNFALFAHGQPVIVDTGISTYEVGDRRHHERSTAAHNTVQVGDGEQSEIWGAFRVARRAKIIQRDVGQNSVTAAYKNFNSTYVHRRVFDFEQQQIQLTDSVVCKYKNSLVVARFHVHPDFDVKVDGMTVAAGPVSFGFKGAVKIQLMPYEYAPEFNKLVPATCIEVQFEHLLETVISI